MTRIIFFLIILLFSTVFAEGIVETIGLEKYLTGKYEPRNYPQFFSKVPQKYVTKTIYLRTEVLGAFLQMAKEAEKEGIKMDVLSGFRSYDYQKGIWQRKYDGVFAKKYPDEKERFYEILKYSAIPGISRHHWGTEFDILSLDGSYFTHGKGKREKKWLDEHAEKYGFYLVYTPGRKRGYHDEAWHFTYKPLSEKLLPLVRQLKKADVMGFHGDKNIVDFEGFIEAFMFDINPELLPKKN